MSRPSRIHLGDYDPEAPVQDDSEEHQENDDGDDDDDDDMQIDYSAALEDLQDAVRLGRSIYADGNGEDEEDDDGGGGEWVDEDDEDEDGDYIDEDDDDYMEDEDDELDNGDGDDGEGDGQGDREEDDDDGEGDQMFTIQVGEEGSGDATSALRNLIARLTGTSTTPSTGPIILPPGALRALLESGTLRSTSGGGARRGGRGGRGYEEDEDDDDDDEPRLPGSFSTSTRSPRSTRQKGWNWFPLRTKPIRSALELSRNGEFGRVGFPSVRYRLPTTPGCSPPTCGEDDKRLDRKVDGTTKTIGKTGTTVTTGTPGTNDISGLYNGIEGQGEKKDRVDESLIEGIKVGLRGRGKWGLGEGWKREVGRGIWGGSGREEWARHCVPNSNGTIVATYNSSPYIGKHSHDCSFFYTATQSFQLHLYSTEDTVASPPPRSQRSHTRGPRGARQWLGTLDDDYDEEDSSLRKIKTVQGVEGRWTVTDADLSRDNEWMIYSSITSKVHLLRTAEHEDEHTQLDFGSGSMRNSIWGDDALKIWSIRFSADQKEIVAGAGSGQIMVYDIENRKRVLSVNAHQEDVNGVCFADENSTNVIVSASDDGYLKVWDRRSLASETPSGVLVGHTEGITYVAPKGDGRYVVSNGKDQAVRLWDLRKMRSHTEVRDEDATISYGLRGWDYRNGVYRKPRYLAHPQDCSVMTYRGMHTLRTLIRCNFSPTSTTGGSYIYTGGANGIIYVFALDGRIVQVLDRTRAAPLRQQDGSYSDPSAPSASDSINYNPDPRGDINCTVRDVSWSSVEPSLISTAWEYSYSRGGNVAVHHWRGLGKGGLNRLEDWVEKSAANSLDD